MVSDDDGFNDTFSADCADSPGLDDDQVVSGEESAEDDDDEKLDQEVNRRQ